MQKHIVVSPSPSAVNVRTVDHSARAHRLAGRIAAVPLVRSNSPCAAARRRTRRARRASACCSRACSTKAQASSTRRASSARSTRRRSSSRSTMTATPWPGGCERSPKTSTAPPNSCGSPPTRRASTRSRSSACASTPTRGFGTTPTIPRSVAGRAWRSNAFPGHPYSQPSEGTLETLAVIEPADLVAAAKRVHRPRSAGHCGRRGDRRKRRGRSGRQGVRRSAGQGRSQARRRGGLRGARGDRPDPARRAPVDHPLRPAGPHARRSRLYSRASSPRMCSAARAT